MQCYLDCQYIITNKLMKAPVYIVKPKYIFKHPFNKYDLSNPTNRETQNEELTDYFNYGFNEDTMNIYGKLVKRIIEVLDHRKNLQYFNEPSELMRLNDQIPMDFGGFCKFHDISLLNTDTNENFHTGESLMEYFILMVLSKKIDFPLIEFLKRMYISKDEQDEGRDNVLYQIVEQIGKNIEKKYEETLKKLRDQKSQNKPQQNLYKKKPFARQNETAPRNEAKTEEKKEQKSESSSGSDSSSDDSSNSSEDEAKKRRKSQRRSRSSKKGSKKDKEKKRKDKEKTKSSKTKKVKKEKSKKKSRSRSRDRGDHKKKYK